MLEMTQAMLTFLVSVVASIALPYSYRAKIKPFYTVIWTMILLHCSYFAFHPDYISNVVIATQPGLSNGVFLRKMKAVCESWVLFAALPAMIISRGEWFMWAAAAVISAALIVSPSPGVGGLIDVKNFDTTLMALIIPFLMSRYTRPRWCLALCIAMVLAISLVDGETAKITLASYVFFYMLFQRKMLLPGVVLIAGVGLYLYTPETFTAGDRPEIISVAWNWLHKYGYEWWGLGAGSYSWVARGLNKAALGLAYAGAHNDYIEIAFSFGYIGLAAFAMLCLKTLYDLLKQKQVWMAAGFSSFLVSMLAYSTLGSLLGCVIFTYYISRIKKY